MAASVRRLRCPAKVNLFLAVGDRRPDGFHEVSTLLQTLELADLLEAVPPRGSAESGERSLLVSGPGAAEVPPGEDNLVLRAERLFRERRGLAEPGPVLRLVKNIPAGTGLGGASSDAAAALRLLRGLLDPSCPDEELVGMAAELGSDVPFFLAGGTGRARGRGERVERLEDLPPLGVLLLVPSIRLPTGKVYERFDRLRKTLTASGSLPKMRTITENLRAGRRVELRNDLETAALDLVPGMRDLRRILEDLSPLAVGMSGSGSAWFALFPDAKGAREAGEKLPAADVELHVTTFAAGGRTESESESPHRLEETE